MKIMMISIKSNSCVDDANNNIQTDDDDDDDDDDDGGNNGDGTFWPELRQCAIFHAMACLRWP